MCYGDEWFSCLPATRRLSQQADEGQVTRLCAAEGTQPLRAVAEGVQASPASRFLAFHCQRARGGQRAVRAEQAWDNVSLGLEDVAEKGLGWPRRFLPVPWAGC